MKLKIISDIHCDLNVNDKYNYDFKDDFVICCGDISGDRFQTEAWIDKNITKGIIVAGNHLGYNWVTNDEDDTLDNSIKYLKQKYEGTQIHFLENQHITLDDIVFIGCTLFTDFNLYNKEYISRMVAYKYLNDYRYVKIIKNKKIKLMSVAEQVLRFKRSIKYIESICKKFKKHKIVIVTHHAPSELSIAEQYKNDLLSAAFASNLENLILKYENIKLWCHGHVHNNCDYTINNARVIANPRGYGNENPEFLSEGIIIDTNEL